MNICDSAEGIRLIVQSVDSHPVCEHGPALLFERYIDGKCQQFYACSAYRDQKECPLHIPVNQNQLKPYNRDLLLANAEKSLKLAQIQSNLLQKVNRLAHLNFKITFNPVIIVSGIERKPQSTDLLPYMPYISKQYDKSAKCSKS